MFSLKQPLSWFVGKEYWFVVDGSKAYFHIKGLVSKEAVVLCQWGSEIKRKVYQLSCKNCVHDCEDHSFTCN